MILATFLCGGRLIVRIHWDKQARGNEETEIKRVLIVGAGLAGERSST